MNLTDNLVGAIRSLRSNLLRSLLTMLGMIIGVAAVIAMLAIGNGAQAAVAKQIDALGTNLITVNPGRFRVGGVASGANASATLTYADALAIGELHPYVVSVAPVLSKSFQISVGRQNTNTNVNGTTPSYSKINNWDVQEGHFFTDQNMQDGSLVAIVGTSTATTLFGLTDPVGQSIQINGLPFTVIGLMSERASPGFGNNNDQVFIPITTAHFRLIGGPSLSTSAVRSINVEAASAADSDAAVSAITTLLEERHHITSPVNDDFVIFSQSQILQTRSGVVSTFTVLLASIAAVSLLIGGIGIMNIMLVTVTERTREIGIRKAIGASARAIMTQFILEALLLSLVGGLLGVLLGPLASQAYGALAHTDTRLTVGPILLATCVSVAIGLFFGIYPAHRASKLDPIQALRSD